MPIELGDAVRDLAKTNRRPFNTQIIVLLENAIREKQRKKKKYHSDSESSK